MKLNQWTLGLAAMGVISLSSAVRAEEAAVPLMTALSSTTISGYVDTSAHWNLGTGTGGSSFPYLFGGSDKADGFNLNVVQLSISKPLDETDWAAGYRVDLWLGPDANTLGTQSTLSMGSGDLAIRQAYVAMRAPVGNGVDVKMGVFDSVIGYESIAAVDNPNYTRSYGRTIEPTTHTGVLASYRVNELVSLSAGVADTVGPVINERAFPPKAESYKTYLGSIAITAPDSWGWLAGSTLYGGVVNGFNGAAGENQTSWYLGATVATPIEGFRLGAAWDVLDLHDASGDLWAVSVYGSYAATEKLSLHLRGELATSVAGVVPGTDNAQIWALTGTVQYDLWQNVLTRAEVRWDHGDEAAYFTPNRRNSVLVAANVIYKF
ncbi:MAG: outer membrane beta-barrel protein [Verrucomicrobiota bacterium]|nr:porin [Limisphaera sp.]MDW8382146.1 outer membrane beta-barrel protein [Verrucomicrobiota bacterium]